MKCLISIVIILVVWLILAYATGKAIETYKNNE